MAAAVVVPLPRSTPAVTVAPSSRDSSIFEKLKNVPYQTVLRLLGRLYGFAALVGCLSLLVFIPVIYMFKAKVIGLEERNINTAVHHVYEGPLRPAFRFGIGEFFFICPAITAVSAAGVAYEAPFQHHKVSLFGGFALSQLSVLLEYFIRLSRSQSFYIALAYAFMMVWLCIRPVKMNLLETLPLLKVPPFIHRLINSKMGRNVAFIMLLSIFMMYLYVYLIPRVYRPLPISGRVIYRMIAHPLLFFFFIFSTKMAIARSPGSLHRSRVAVLIPVLAGLTLFGRLMVQTVGDGVGDAILFSVGVSLVEIFMRVNERSQVALIRRIQWLLTCGGIKVDPRPRYLLQSSTRAHAEQEKHTRALMGHATASASHNPTGMDLTQEDALARPSSTVITAQNATKHAMNFSARKAELLATSSTAAIYNRIDTREMESTSTGNVLFAAGIRTQRKFEKVGKKYLKKYPVDTAVPVSPTEGAPSEEESPSEEANAEAVGSSEAEDGDEGGNMVRVLSPQERLSFSRRQDLLNLLTSHIILWETVCEATGIIVTGVLDLFLFNGHQINSTTVTNMVVSVLSQLVIELVTDIIVLGWLMGVHQRDLPAAWNNQGPRSIIFFCFYTFSFIIFAMYNVTTRLICFTTSPRGNIVLDFCTE